MIEGNIYKCKNSPSYEGTIYEVDLGSDLASKNKHKAGQKMRKSSDDIYHACYLRTKEEGKIEIFVPSLETPEEIEFDLFGFTEKAEKKEETELNAQNKRDRKVVERILYQRARKIMLSNFFWPRNKQRNVYMKHEYENVGKFRLYKGVQIRFDVLKDGDILLTLDPKVSATFDNPITDLVKKQDFRQQFLSGESNRWGLVDYPNERNKKIPITDVREGKKIENITFDDYKEGGEINVYDFQMREREELEGIISSDEPPVVVKYHENDDPSHYPSCVVHPFADTEEWNNEISDRSSPESDDRVSDTISFKKGNFDRFRVGDWFLEFPNHFADIEGKEFDLPVLEFGGDSTINPEKIGLENWRWSKKNGLSNHGPRLDPNINKLFLIYPNSEDIDDIRNFYDDLKRVAKEHNITIPSKNNVQFEGVKKGNYSEIVRKYQDHDYGVFDYLVAIMPHNSSEDYESLKRIPAKSQAINDVYHYDMGHRLDDALLGILSSISAEAGEAWLLGEDLSGDCIISIDVSKNNYLSYSYVFGKKGEYIDVSKGEVQKGEDMKERRMRRAVKDTIKTEYSGEENLERIIIHRDGEVTSQEKEGLKSAIDELREGTNIVDDDTEYVALNVKKDNPFRLYRENDEGKLDQPNIGTYMVIDEHKGIVCNTGNPTIPGGTADPLLVRKEVASDASIEMEPLLKDIFYLSELNWQAPLMTMKLPITIKLAENRANMEESGFHTEGINL